MTIERWTLGGFVAEVEGGADWPLAIDVAPGETVYFHHGFSAPTCVRHVVMSAGAWSGWISTASGGPPISIASAQVTAPLASDPFADLDLSLDTHPRVSADELLDVMRSAPSTPEAFVWTAIPRERNAFRSHASMTVKLHNVGERTQRARVVWIGIVPVLPSSEARAR